MPINRSRLAIPFVGKDVPSASSEFANPDIVIGLTLLAFHYEGMRLRDVQELTRCMKVCLFVCLCVCLPCAWCVGK